MVLQLLALRDLPVDLSCLSFLFCHLDRVIQSVLVLQQVLDLHLDQESLQKHSNNSI